MYAARGRLGVSKPPMHFHCVGLLHGTKRGGGRGGPDSIKNAYVINGRPLILQKIKSSIIFIVYCHGQYNMVNII